MKINIKQIIKEEVQKVIKEISDTSVTSLYDMIQEM